MLAREDGKYVFRASVTNANGTKRAYQGRGDTTTTRETSPRSGGIGSTIVISSQTPPVSPALAGGGLDRAVITNSLL